MKKIGKRIWVWILSGLAIILGGCILSNCTPSKLYGPPPPDPNNDSIQKTITFENEP